MRKLIGALAATLMLIVAKNLHAMPLGGSGWRGLDVVIGRENHVLADVLPSS